MRNSESGPSRVRQDLLRVIVLQFDKTLGIQLMNTLANKALHPTLPASLARRSRRAGERRSLAGPGTMRRRSSTALLPLVVLLNAGCGYFAAGTWEDDPDNWRRAFQSTKPAERRSCPFHPVALRALDERFEYFFEIAPQPSLTAQLFGQNKMRRVTDEEAKQIRKNALGEAPSWFAPKVVTEYEVWVFEGEPGRNFKAFIDKKSGVVFLNDYQV